MLRFGSNIVNFENSEVFTLDWDFVTPKIPEYKIEKKLVWVK